MEYFQIETDKKNRIPYGINVNRAVDIRYANRDMAYKIPNCCVVDMRTPMEVFFPDMMRNRSSRLTAGRQNSTIRTAIRATRMRK